jgi:hypothetical protein
MRQRDPAGRTSSRSAFTNLCRPLQVREPCRSIAEKSPCLVSINDSFGGLAGCEPSKIDWFGEDLDQTMPGQGPASHRWRRHWHVACPSRETRRDGSREMSHCHGFWHHDGAEVLVRRHPEGSAGPSLQRGGFPVLLADRAKALRTVGLLRASTPRSLASCSRVCGSAYREADFIGGYREERVAGAVLAEFRDRPRTEVSRWSGLFMTNVSGFTGRCPSRLTVAG